MLVGPSATRLATAVAASDGALLAAREIYQAPYTEPFLVGLPMLAHVASGVAMRLLRWRQNLRRYGGATPGMRALARKRDHEDPSGTSKEQERRIQSAWPRVTYVALSGHVLFPLVAIHMFVNRILPLRHPAAGDSSAIALAYVSHGFARHGRPGGRLSWLLGPAVWAFYGALVVLGAGHIVWGWARWLGVESAVLGTGPAGILRLGWRRTATDSTELAAGPAGRAQFDPETRRRRRRSWWSVQAVAVATAVAWAAGGLGVVARAGAAPGWIGKLYDALYDSVGL